jgi:hypothetical protein
MTTRVRSVCRAEIGTRSNHCRSVPAFRAPISTNGLAATFGFSFLTHSWSFATAARNRESIRAITRGVGDRRRCDSASVWLGLALHRGCYAPPHLDTLDLLTRSFVRLLLR